MKNIKIVILIFLLIQFSVMAKTEIDHFFYYKKDDTIFISLDLDLNLKQEVDNAVRNGVTLHFVYEFKLYESTFQKYINSQIISKSYFLEYNQITKEYLLKNPITYEVKSFKSKDAVINEIKSLRDFPLINVNLLKNKKSYLEVRFILNKNTLPTYLRVESIWYSDWDINSQWKRWEIK